MTARLLIQCGLCGSRNLETVLSLGASPPTCVMVPVGSRQATECHHPLELLRCHDCTLVQLSVVVDPDVMFPPDYPYSSGNSRALHDDFADLAQQAAEWLEPDDLVVDVGANDGTLLSKFDCRTVGIEPTGQADRIMGPAYKAPFTEKLARRIRDAHGPAKVITACNVLAHVADIGDVMRGIGVLLAEDGVLIAENHDLASMVDGEQWDVIYHEHLRFYDPHSFSEVLVRYGLASREWTPIPTHGGSFRMIAKAGRRTEVPPQRDYDFEALADTAKRARRELRRVSGAWGIGATARATTIINYCGMDVEDIPCVCEVADSDKIGHFVPGSRIPIIDEARLFDEQPERVVLFAWHLPDLAFKLRERGYHGEIIVPLPQVRRLECAASTA
jgi:hypothetical protein